MHIQNSMIITADIYLDYIPIMSTCFNGVLLFQKCMNYWFPVEVVQGDHYFQLVKNKPILRCVIVLFPFIGNIAVAFYDFVECQREIKMVPKEVAVIDESVIRGENQSVVNEDEFETHSKAALNGSISSMIFLAQFYRKEKMDEKELEWLLKAADSGHAESNREVALMFEEENGIRFNLNKALEYYQKSTFFGDIQSMLKLAYMYFYYEEFQSRSKAVLWYSKAAECNNSFAKKWLIKFRELEALEERAQRNDSEAMFQLGKFYEDNMEFEDEDESWEWMNKAADLNHVEALKELAANDDTVAMYKLGKFYTKGLNGVSVNLEEAFKFYLKGAELENERCMLKTSSCYKKGKGVPMDQKKAIIWRDKANIQFSCI